MNGLQAQAAPLPIDSAAEQARLTARSAHIGGLAPNVSLATPSGAHNDDSVVASVSIRQGSYNSREFHQHHDMGCPPDTADGGARVGDVRAVRCRIPPAWCCRPSSSFDHVGSAPPRAPVDGTLAGATAAALQRSCTSDTGPVIIAITGPVSFYASCSAIRRTR